MGEENNEKPFQAFHMSKTGLRSKSIDVKGHRYHNDDDVRQAMSTVVMRALYSCLVAFRQTQVDAID